MLVFVNCLEMKPQEKTLDRKIKESIQYDSSDAYRQIHPVMLADVNKKTLLSLTIPRDACVLLVKCTGRLCRISRRFFVGLL